MGDILFGMNPKISCLFFFLLIYRSLWISQSKKCILLNNGPPNLIEQMSVIRLMLLPYSFCLFITPPVLLWIITNVVKLIQHISHHYPSTIFFFFTDCPDTEEPLVIIKEITNLYFFNMGFHICRSIRQHYNKFNIPRALLQQLTKKEFNLPSHSLELCV